MKPTKEQFSVVEKPVSKAVIKALAGTGKTTLFRMFANHYPELRFLYLSYNRAIVDSANLPKNCKALSGHQLAYQFVGKYYRSKIKDNLSMGVIKHKLGVNWSEAGGVVQTLESYFNSEDSQILLHHAPVNPRNSHSVSLQPRLVELAKRVWDEMQTLDGAFPMTHDGYLKGFTISNVDLSEYFDVLLIDEAQDLNPCLQAFIKAQSNMRIYLCGDQAQQIYRYRGAENSLGWFEGVGAEVFTLTQSFRFNQQVAGYANAFLSHLKVSERLRGIDNGVNCSIVSSEEQLDSNEQIAYINRTVAKTIETAIEANSNGKSIYWTGGFKSYPFAEIFDVLYLKLERFGEIKSREILKHFESYSEYVEAASKTGRVDMNRILKLIKKYDTELFTIYESLKASAKSTQSEACVVVGTCHRTKGLEFPQVVLGDDFLHKDTLVHKPLEELIDELNLMYVAITRCQLRLVTSEPFDSVRDSEQNLIDLAQNLKLNKKRSKREGAKKNSRRRYNRRAA